MTSFWCREGWDGGLLSFVLDKFVFDLFKLYVYSTCQDDFRLIQKQRYMLPTFIYENVASVWWPLAGGRRLIPLYAQHQWFQQYPFVKVDLRLLFKCIRMSHPLSLPPSPPHPPHIPPQLLLIWDLIMLTVCMSCCCFDCVCLCGGLGLFMCLVFSYDVLGLYFG